MPLSNFLIISNAILLVITLVCGAVMLHAAAQYSWTTGQAEQTLYEKRILKIIVSLVFLGLLAAALNLFGQ